MDACVTIVSPWIGQSVTTLLLPLPVIDSCTVRLCYVSGAARHAQPHRIAV
jgi:hypothetical protein